MDPEATLREASEALQDGRPALAVAALCRYLSWRAAGGFEPPDGDRTATRIRHQATAALKSLRARKKIGENR